MSTEKKEVSNAARVIALCKSSEFGSFLSRYVNGNYKVNIKIERPDWDLMKRECLSSSDGKVRNYDQVVILDREGNLLRKVGYNFRNPWYIGIFFGWHVMESVEDACEAIWENKYKIGFIVVYSECEITIYKTPKNVAFDVFMKNELYRAKCQLEAEIVAINSEEKA